MRRDAGMTAAVGIVLLPAMLVVGGDAGALAMGGLVVVLLTSGLVRTGVLDRPDANAQIRR